MDELAPGSAPGGPLHQPAHTVIEGSPGKVPSSRTICPQVSEGKELRRKEKNSADQAGPNWIVTSSVIYKMLWNISFPFAFNLKPQWGILEAGGEIWGCVPSDSWSSGATVWWSGWSQQSHWAGGMAWVRRRSRKEGKPHHNPQTIASGCAPQPKTKNSKNNSKHLLWPYYVPGIVIRFSHCLIYFLQPPVR